MFDAEMSDAEIGAAIADADMLAREMEGRAPKGAVAISAFLADAQRRAIESVRELIVVDPTDIKQIMILQNEIQRLRDLKLWAREVRERAEEAWSRLEEDQRAEMQQALSEEP